MAEAKNSEFSSDFQQLALWCKALGHPARVAIVKILMEKSQCHCGELVTGLPLSQATVSQHLKALKQAGLIRGEVEGPRSRYCLDTENFQKLLNSFDQVRQSFDESCC